MPDNLDSVFVYGTLKTGQCRESLWPCKALEIRTAFVRGTLFDLGPYPAMTDGQGWVHGEVWRFKSKEMPLVLHTLDEIEGFQQPLSEDLYVRRQIAWHEDILLPQLGESYIYLFAKPDRLQVHQKIDPPNTIAHWPYGSTTS